MGHWEDLQRVSCGFVTCLLGHYWRLSSASLQKLHHLCHGKQKRGEQKKSLAFSYLLQSFEGLCNAVSSRRVSQVPLGYSCRVSFILWVEERAKQVTSLVCGTMEVRGSEFLKRNAALSFSADIVKTMSNFVWLVWFAIDFFIWDISMCVKKDI